MNQHAPDSRPRLTAKQGQYLAFIHAYRRPLGQSPAEADMQRFFQVTSPSVHQMVLSLEKAGLITRQPGIARSITLTIDPADLPELASRYDQPVKIAVQSY
jgi:DNA-binding MarR family transcriptional regulator